MTKIAIVAHTSRKDMVLDLYRAVGADTVFVDDGTLGAAGNHRRAWEWLHLNNRGGWSVVLEDDAIPCDDFRLELDTALDAAPASIVSLYLGTDRPRHWQGRIEQAMADAADTDAAWIVTTNLLHAVAVAAHWSVVPSMIRWTRHLGAPIDARQVDGLPVAYTVPSLVDHADGPPVADHGDGTPRNAPRIAHRFGTRDDWHTPIIRM
jgi:hypothetical protein